MATQLTTGVSQRLSRSSNRWWQVATHWRAYVDYLNTILNQLGDVNLPGLGEIKLDDSYVPLALRPWQREADQGELRAPVEAAARLNLAEALEADAHVLLVGPAGTGKSALLRWHAIQSARAVLDTGRRVLLADGGPPPLPVYIPLTAIPPSQPIEAYAAALVAATGFDGAAAFLSTHLESGRTVLLFDDLDTLTPQERRAAAERVADLVVRYPQNRVVVATRDLADQAWLPDFRVLEVVGIDPARVETLTARWGYGQLANTSGFMQVVERIPLVRSLVARPGWLATALAGVARLPEPIRALDVVGGFVHQLDHGDESVWHPIALALHKGGTTTGRIDAVPVERQSSGLLQWLSIDTFRFVHPAVQVYLAAGAMAEDGQALVDLAGDPWWDPLIVMAAGRRSDARSLVESLLAAGHSALAALALAEVRPIPVDLRERVVIALLDRLGSQGRDADQTVAVSVAGLLGAETIRRAGIITPALEALGDDHPSIRRAGASALARLADPSAIAPLLTALGDPDPQVRDAASDALAAFGDRTVQPLVRQLNVPNQDVRRAAMRALGHQGERAVAPLVALLDASTPAARADAAEALSRIGAGAVPALVAVLGDAPPQGSRSELQVDGAVDALTRIGRPAAAALIPIYVNASPAAARQIALVIRSMGPEAIGVLGERLEQPDYPHATAAAALLGEFTETGTAAAAPLVRALADPRFEVRWETRRSLRRLGPVAMPALLDELDSPDPHLRWEAAQLLMALPEPPTGALIRILGEFMDSADVAGRRRAVGALGDLAGPEVRPLLERAIRDADPLVRRAAVARLGGLGDPRAADALVQQWQSETDPDTALATLRALADLAPSAAIPTLIDALAADDRDVRQEATFLLAEIGEPAVDPLIRALNARPAEIDLEGALRVLERAGATARADGRAPANLARAYHRMLVEPHEVDELVYLATTIEWWPPAVELHRTFTTLRQFLDFSSLGGIGGAETELEWIDGGEEWLRPAARRAFRQLRMIAQAVQYYNRGATRRAKEKGLLAAADRLNTLRAMIGELGEPHTRVFHSVTEHWNALINQAIRELQGRADLDLDMRTEHVRIRDADTAAVLVFEIFNKREGLASNVQLTLSVDGEALTLESPPTHFLPPLGQGDRISTEYTVRRRGAGVVTVTVEVRYDDPQKEGQVRRFNPQVRFFVEEAEYRDIGSSPFIAGPPVKSRQMFYGRQTTFNWIQENLSGTYQDNVLVLYGERRTGKTSVLYQLQYHLPELYAFVLVDLQSIAYALDSTSDLLYAMARKTVNGLKRQGFDLARPEREDFDDRPIEQFEILGEAIGDMAIAMGRRAVLIADEFDLLIEAVDRGTVNVHVFDLIRGLMQHQDGLSFIFAGAHALTAMLKDTRSILFNTALRRKVSFLERPEAERLIREPVAEVLWYDDLAVEKILRVTAGQPYFIQYICHEIVNLARRDAKNFVTLRDVDRALQTTVQETTGIIRHSYMSLSPGEQVTLAALARITDDGRPFVSLEDVSETLGQDNVLLSVHDLVEMMAQLRARDFITERGGDSAGRQYGFAMDLVRIWLEQNDEYTRLLEELRA